MSDSWEDSRDDTQDESEMTPVATPAGPDGQVDATTLRGLVDDVLADEPGQAAGAQG